MTKKDFTAGIIIGAAVGLLIQPILANSLSHVHLSLAARGGIFIFFTLLAPCALWIAWTLSKWGKGIYQFSQFAAVGTLNSFIDIGIFNLELFFYGSSIIGTVLFAVFKAISFLFATTNSFFWNKSWTFGDEHKAQPAQVSEFYGIAVIGWILNVGIATLVKVAGPADSKVWVAIVAPVAGIAASFIFNFIGYKYFVFKKKEAAI